MSSVFEKLLNRILFSDYNGLPVSGSYVVKEAAAILIDRKRTDPFEKGGVPAVRDRLVLKSVCEEHRKAPQTVEKVRGIFVLDPFREFLRRDPLRLPRPAAAREDRKDGIQIRRRKSADEGGNRLSLLRRGSERADTARRGRP